MKTQDWLKSIGYTVTSNPLSNDFNLEKWYAYRQIKSHCQKDVNNPDKPQILVIYPYKMNVIFPLQFELEILGGVTDYECYRLTIYGVTEDHLYDNLDNYEATLVRLWNAI